MSYVNVRPTFGEVLSHEQFPRDRVGRPERSPVALPIDGSDAALQPGRRVPVRDAIADGIEFDRDRSRAQVLVHDI